MLEILQICKKKRHHDILILINLQMPSGYVICQICQSYHDNMEELNAHYETDHPQAGNTKRERKFQCDQCDKQFTSKYGLAYHKKRMHYVTTESPLGEFQCNQCDKRYVKRETLKATWRNCMTSHFLRFLGALVVPSKLTRTLNFRASVIVIQQNKILAWAGANIFAFLYNTEAVWTSVF